jgi:hypothetical protein
MPRPYRFEENENITHVRVTIVAAKSGTGEGKEK